MRATRPTRVKRTFFAFIALEIARARVRNEKFARRAASALGTIAVSLVSMCSRSGFSVYVKNRYKVRKKREKRSRDMSDVRQVGFLSVYCHVRKY